MRLALYITKNLNIKDYTKPAHIKIAVIDKDISNNYPSNFVCILPRTFNPNNKNPSQFQQKYGNQSKQLIEELLKKALQTQEDQDIKKEIYIRLKRLKPKPKNLTKCKTCGKEFNARKYRYGKQTICNDCRAKRYNNKEDEKP